MNGLIIDLFAGGGGASLGIEKAFGRPVDYAVNHDEIAIKVHQANHPKTVHLTSCMWKVRPKDVVRGRPVDFMWASPDCRDYSRAKGGKPRDQKIRFLPWTVRRWAKDVRPKVIVIENVPEFRDWGPLDHEDKPIKKRKGESFRRWIRELEKLGYVVDYKILNAADYGAPTARKRIFIVARCDGQPIRWPAPTHGGLGLLPYRSAASCIDFSLPIASIFGRKTKTGKPKPLKPATERRIAEGLWRFVIRNPNPFIVPGSGDPYAPTLIQTSYGEREGQKPRVLDIHQPLGTIVAGGVKHSLVAAFLSKHYKGVVGVPLDGRPLDTITTKDHHALSVACLAKFRGTSPNQPGACSITEPLPTISAGGIHVAEVRAFLTAYYGSKDDAGQALSEPLRTIPTKDRFGLVTIEGVLHEIIKICMRMLRWDELARAQLGPFAENYDMSAAKSQKDKIRLIGNSVCPQVAEALVRVNLPEQARIAEAAE